MTGYKKIFLDTAPVIYFVEKKPGFYEKVRDLLVANADADYVSSVITLAEYFPYPLRQPNKEELTREFHTFLERAEITLLNIDRMIAMEAARIRAEYPAFRMMDSLQLASALSYGCDLFLTNDKQLRQFRELSCVTLEQL